LFSAGATINFVGTASDAQDGNLTSKLIWISSIDGQIGTGGSFARTLSSGTHTITAKATDSGGSLGTASVKITVSAPNNSPPTVTIVSPLTGFPYPYGSAIIFAASARS